MLFGQRATGGPGVLVVGLGNPGREYEGTRHNIGWQALDAAAATWGANVSKSRFQALTGDAVVAGQRVLLLKPLTFMNASGDAVAAAAAFYKIPPQRVIVLSDDINLAVGVLRIRTEGSAGGHNGLKSIIARLGSQQFCRLRIGVGQKPRPDYDLVDWVLGRFSAEDTKLLQARMPDIVAALELLVAEDPQTAISRYNGGAKPTATKKERRAGKDDSGAAQGGADMADISSKAPESPDKAPPLSTTH